MRFQTFRHWVYEFHLWLGIVSGIILFVVCLSGAILVFQEEAQHIAEPAKYYVDVPKEMNTLAVNELIANVETAKPAMKVTALTIPEQPNRTVTVTLASLKQDGERGGAGHRSRGSVIYVNPYTGGIVGEGANIVDPFFLSMMLLHRFLWLPTEIGRPIVGIATIIFVVLYLSGTILWLPKTWKAFAMWKAWKPGLLVRAKRGTWLLVYDLHSTVGFYLLIPSLILALTGLCWSFTWYRDAGSYTVAG